MEVHYNGLGYVGSGQQDVEEALEAPEPQQTQDTEKPPAGIVNTMTLARGIPGITCYPCEGGANASAGFSFPQKRARSSSRAAFASAPLSLPGDTASRV